MIEIIPEFSRPILVDTIPARGCEIDVVANAEECAALARRFQVVAVEALTARIHLQAMAGGAVFRVRGRLDAKVVQTCVVTLEPLEQSIKADFSLTFGASAENAGLEVDLSMDEDDPPESLKDGAIDVGEVVAEHLALALDPFPRREGAEMIPMAEETLPIPTAKPHPFAALRGWKEKKG